MKSLLLIFIAGFALAEDYYSLLGVPKDADEKTIKKAFKKISLESHPDRGKNTEAMFMKISQVYEVLSDPMKREIYDTFGEQGIVNPFRYNIQSIHDNYFTTKVSHFNYETEYIYKGDESVIEVMAKDRNRIYKREDIWFIEFYGPRSKESRLMTGEWKALGKRLNGIVNVAAVNCDENQELCVEFNIKKYPAVIFFPDNLESDHELYSGPRTFKSFYDFVMGKISWFLRPVTSQTISDFLEADTYKIISFTNTKDNLPIVKKLAKEYKGRVLFGEAKASDFHLVKKYSLLKFPCFVRVGSGHFEVFEKSDEASIRDWIEATVPKTETKVLIKELNKAQFLAGNCNDKDTYFCLISVDPSPDSKILLNDLAVKYETEPIKFFYLLSIKYPKLSQTLGPISIIKGIKGQYHSVHCETFECLSDSVRKTISGTQEFSQVSGLSFTESNLDL